MTIRTVSLRGRIMDRQAGIVVEVQLVCIYGINSHLRQIDHNEVKVWG